MREVPTRSEFLQKLAQAIVSLDPDAAERLTHQALEAGVDPNDAVVNGLAIGMKEIGDTWQRLEIFLPEVMVASEAFLSAMKILRPHMKSAAERRFEGTMVMGTIFGDIHEVGKEVAIPVFQATIPIDVIDLGVDVPPEKFVEAVRERGAQIVGLGTYMSETFMHTQTVVEALKKAGLREKVKIICGGPAVDENYARQ
ncbi:MAG: B12-binding domain-containing protein, partial [Candidatus Bathyarchaeia archaeon]